MIDEVSFKYLGNSMKFFDKQSNRYYTTDTSGIFALDEAARLLPIDRKFSVPLT